MASKIEIVASDNAQTPLFGTAASLTAPVSVQFSGGYVYTNIVSAVTTVVSLVPCTLVAIETGNPGTTNAVVIYDSLTATGTKISSTTAWTDRTRTYGVTCGIGLTITTSATCDIITRTP